MTALALPAVQAIDAHALIAQAIERGTDPAALERLVTLAERMLATQARQAWTGAMVAAQAAFPAILKSKSAEIATRRGGSYNYKYAPLDEIDGALKPVLHEHHFVATWQYDTVTKPGEVGANCRLLHALGHVEESGYFFVPIEPGREDGAGASAPQRAGIASTYARRYSLCAVAGIVPEDDDDARPHGNNGHAPSADAEPPPVTRPDGTVLVTGVEERSGNKKAGGRWVKWVIAFDNDTTADTWIEGDATLARQYQQDQTLVVAVTEQKGQYTNLVSLAPPEPPGPVGDALNLFADEVSGGGYPDPQGDGARDAVPADEARGAQDGAPVDEKLTRALANSAVVAFADKLKLRGPERTKLWAEYCGTKTPADVPLVYLQDLVAELKRRAGE